PLDAPVTALQWLDEHHLACGLEDGMLVLIAGTEEEQGGRDRASALLSSVVGSRQGRWRIAVSKRFHGSGGSGSGERSVLRIRLSGEGVTGDREGSVGGNETLTLWVLYDDRIVVCVSVESLMAMSRCVHISGNMRKWNSTADNLSTPMTPAGVPLEADSPDTPSPSFAKLQLEGQTEITDVVACPAPPGLFELRPDRCTHLLLTSGVSPALALYPIGSEVRTIGLASLAWAVASKVTALTTGAIGGIFGLVGLWGRGSRSTEDENGATPAPLVLRWDGALEDHRRRVTQLCVDPSGRLVAAADDYGRVLLVDCRSRQVNR
ncbi:unnamed protein product, partial [Choristocarpus tenellus]